MPIRISGSTGISGLDGSATTPVLQGASANSGIYYSGNTVFVSTSSTNALTIGPTGNVAFANSNFSIAGQTISAYSGMMKNRIINGNMRIDQRFAGAANNNIAAPQYQVDRWYHQGIVAGKLRFQQNNTNGPGSSATQLVTGFSNYFGANVVSSNTVNSSDYWFMVQPIEGLNVADLNWGTPSASPVTLSFWSYSSIAGTHSGSILSSNVARSYPFSYTINTANTWQYQTITIPGDTSSTANWYSNNNIGMYVIYSLGVGSTQSGTAGSWASYNFWAATGAVQVVNNANGSFYLTGVQLEKGSQATAFEFRHYTTEFDLCRRYFQKSYNDDVIPGTSTDVSIVVAGDWNGGERGISVPLPIRMRASPTVKMWDRAGNINKYSSLNSTGASGTWYDNFGSLTLASSGQSNFLFYPGSSSSLITAIHFWASAELGPQN
jgi:hypothetical protein